jgi:hypothetical protein
VQAGSERRAGQPSGPEPLLPAPYRSPWRRLGESLRAVVADLGLVLRRLLRLNRQGELPIPPFWPQGLAALFWPLVLSLGLALLLGGGLWLRPWSPQKPTQAALHPPAAAPVHPPQAEPVADPAVDPALERAVEGGVDMGVEAAAESSPGASPPLPTVPQGATAPSQARAEAEAAAGDGLQALLAQSEAAGLLASVQADPGQGLLRFALDADFEAMALPGRQRQADRWLAWARELGYEHLELRDGRGRLVAREALVGDGMILLTSRPTS